MHLTDLCGAGCSRLASPRQRTGGVDDRGTRENPITKSRLRLRSPVFGARWRACTWHLASLPGRPLPLFPRRVWGAMAWHVRPRDFGAEAQAACVHADDAASHPLQQAAETEAAAAQPSTRADAGPLSEAPAAGGTDPLSAALAGVEYDPLGASLSGARPGAGALDDNPIGVSDRQKGRGKDARRVTPGACSPPGRQAPLLCTRA